MWKLKRTVQCIKCPWRKEVNPHEIPNGYCIDKHKNLDKTIAKDINLNNQQLGIGNNISLRLQMLRCENGNKIRLKGEQHPKFDDTLPI